jgi:hypothetical protein
MQEAKVFAPAGLSNLPARTSCFLSHKFPVTKPRDKKRSVLPAEKPLREVSRASRTSMSSHFQSSSLSERIKLRLATKNIPKKLSCDSRVDRSVASARELKNSSDKDQSRDVYVEFIVLMNEWKQPFNGEENEKIAST